MKNPAACLILMWLTAGVASVSAAPVDCDEFMHAYHEKYGDYSRNGKPSYPERLTYLESIESPSCLNNAYHSIAKAQLLVFLGRFDEALQLLDDADRKGLKPRAYVLETKATTLLLLRKYDAVKISQSLDDINALYQEALEIESKEGQPPNFPVYYAGLAKIASLKGNHDEAAKLIKIAIELGKDTPSKYYSLAGVIASKRKRWNETVRFMEMSMQKNKDNYLSEDETVRAMAEAFCHIGRNDLAARAISLAITENPVLADAPDIHTAQETVKNCPVTTNAPTKNAPLK